MSKYKYIAGYRINNKTGTRIYTGNNIAANPKEKRLIELSTGSKPGNSSESRLVNQSRAIRERGDVLDVPFM